MAPAILILAGGEGRRIGGGKPLRHLAGRTLLERALEHAHDWSDMVAIAVRHHDQVGEVGDPVLIDPPGLEGPLGGLVSALRLERETVLTIPCDVPFLPADLPVRLAEALPRHNAVLSMSGGQVHPACALWRIDALAEARRYASSGRRSLIGFAETVGYATVEWPEGPFFNVNTRKDLAAAETRIR